MLIFNRDDFYDTGWIEEYKNRKKNILWLEKRDTGIPVTRGKFCQKRACQDVQGYNNGLSP